MERDASAADDNSLGRCPRAPSKRPSTSRNRGVTNRSPPTRKRQLEIRAQATHETPACCYIRRDCASTSYRSAALVDVERCVSSMAGLAIFRRFDVPAFLQRLADLNLGQMFLFRPVFSYTLRLPVFRNEIGRIHLLRLPIEIGNLILRAKEILRMAVTLKAPRHAHRLRIINHGHVVDLAVAAGATDSAIHMRGVIVENVIGQPVDPYPVDWSPVFPTLADRLEFRVVLLHLGMAVHAKLRVRNVRMRRDFNEAVAITAIHSELAD